MDVKGADMSVMVGVVQLPREYNLGRAFCSQGKEEINVVPRSPQGKLVRQADIRGCLLDHTTVPW